MSPYLFTLVADVLQMLIKANSGIKHIVLQNAGCLVLQYADDTLLLVRSNPTDVQKPWTALVFLCGTGLQSKALQF